MKLTIPELAVVALIGPSGSGKSSFARKHFRTTEILSSDFCRGLVSDDENDQAATKDAFEVLHYIAAKRLAAAKLVVVDATNVQVEARKPIVELARQYHCIPVAIVFDLPEKLCQERNRSRPDRNFGPHVIRQHSQQLRRSLRNLEREGFRRVHILRSPEEVDAAEIHREPLWNNLKHEHGPFDIIGDVHGCFDELVELLGELGYAMERSPIDGVNDIFAVKPPEGRKAVFLGDLVDRGPQIPEVLRLAMSILSGFPPEVRFLRTRPNVKIDRVGHHTRVRPSVRAFSSRRDGGWDGRRGNLRRVSFAAGLLAGVDHLQGTRGAIAAACVDLAGQLQALNRLPGRNATAGGEVFFQDLRGRQTGKYRCGRSGGCRRRLGWRGRCGCGGNRPSRGERQRGTNS